MTEHEENAAPAQAGEQVQWFIVPPTLQPHVNGMQTIAFYRPKAGHALSPEATYAVRLNEAYLDPKAALESERAYVRAAAMKAGVIIFYPCVGKNPVLIMSGFEEKNIKDGARAIDAAVARVQVVRPPKAHKLEVKAMNHDLAFVRICGRPKHLEALVKMADAKEITLQVKDHHVTGLKYANVHLNPSNITDKLRANVLVAYVHDVISSQSASCQVTVRKNGASLDQTMEIGTALQVLGARVVLRTHGTLRVTMPGPIDTAFIENFKGSYPDWSIFTDTPVNVWAGSQGAQGAPTKPPTIKIPEVTQAVSTGHQVFKIQADYLPHPDSFKNICEAIGATLLHVVTAKYTDSAMSCFIALPAGAGASLLAEPFMIDDWGLWHATPVRGPKKSS